MEPCRVGGSLTASLYSSLLCSVVRSSEKCELSPHPLQLSLRRLVPETCLCTHAADRGEERIWRAGTRPWCSARWGMWSRSQSNLQRPWETGSCLPGCHFPICVFHFSLSGPIWTAGAAATAGFRSWDRRARARARIYITEHTVLSSFGWITLFIAKLN